MLNRLLLPAIIIYMLALFSTAIAKAEEIKPDEKYAKIAVVDIEKIFENSLAIKDLKTKLEKLTQELEQELSLKENILREAEVKLNSEKNLFSEIEYDEKLKVFNNQVSKAQAFMQNRKSEIEKLRIDAVSKLHQAIRDIIVELAKKYNYDQVFPSAYIIYHNSKHDITDESLVLLNKKYNRVEIKNS